MNVLSLFNGMSFCAMALETLEIEVGNYYSSEIDKYANQATQALYPDAIQLGDVTKWREWDIDWSGIGLVTGGFPCQAWSMAGKQLGDKDERGMLFWTMLDIMKHVRYHNPKADFLIENVKMKKEFEEYITHHTENALGKVHKVLINAALVSAQNRNRYYWTSFEVGQPEDKGTVLVDVIKKGTGKHLSESTSKKPRTLRNLRNSDQKAFCMLATMYKLSQSNGMTVINDEGLRCITPHECARLQSVPEHKIDILLNAGISNSQLYKMLGNGWNHDVIVHIFKGLK